MNNKNYINKSWQDTIDGSTFKVENPFTEEIIKRGFSKIDQGAYKLVYSKNRLGYSLITFLFNLLNHTKFTDIYSGYLIFRRENINPNKLRGCSHLPAQSELTRIILFTPFCLQLSICFFTPNASTLAGPVRSIDGLAPVAIINPSQPFIAVLILSELLY